MRLDHVALIHVQDGEMRAVLAEHSRINAYSMVPSRFPVAIAGGATPVPIPNTEVKPSRADGTALVTAWESRSLPG